MKLLKIIFFILITTNHLFANTNYFSEGLDFFEKGNLRKQNLNLNKI